MKNLRCVLFSLKDQRQRPSIYSPNARENFVKLGDRFVLECKAEGYPRPSIKIETPNRPRFAALESLQTQSLLVQYFYLF